MRLIHVAEDRFLSDDVIAEVHRVPDPEWQPKKVVSVGGGEKRLVDNKDFKFLLVIITKRQERIAVDREFTETVLRDLHRSER